MAFYCSVIDLKTVSYLFFAKWIHRTGAPAMGSLALGFFYLCYSWITNYAVCSLFLFIQHRFLCVRLLNSSCASLRPFLGFLFLYFHIILAVLMACILAKLWREVKPQLQVYNKRCSHNMESNCPQYKKIVTKAWNNCLQICLNLTLCIIYSYILYFFFYYSKLLKKVKVHKLHNCC